MLTWKKFDPIIFAGLAGESVDRDQVGRIKKGAKTFLSLINVGVRIRQVLSNGDSCLGCGFVEEGRAFHGLTEQFVIKFFQIPAWPDTFKIVFHCAYCRMTPMAFQPKVVDLDGLRVVLVKDDRQSVMVQSLIDAGSREETELQAG